MAIQAAVRRGDDERRDLATGDRLIDARRYNLGKSMLVLAETVQPHDEGVTLAGIEPRRQINVQVALLAQGLGPDTPVRAVIMRVIDQRAVEPAVHPLELVRP